jgi:Zn-dependent M28 family amino/carboxypeptidase
MPRSLTFLLSILLLSACGPDQAKPDESETVFTPASEVAADLISEDYIRPHIAALSDDAMGGRGPASEGDVLARSYLAEEMARLGLEPGAADGGWEQPFDIVGINATTPDTWVFSGSDGKFHARWWDQYVATSGVQTETASIENAEVVFVGFGIEAPEFGWNDFKGQDLEGKVLLMLNSDPDWDPDLFAGNTRLYYGRWDYKFESAARQGAAGAIIIHTTPSAGYPFQVVQTGWSGEQFELPAEEGPRTQVTGWLSEDAARSLVSLAGLDLAALSEAARSVDFEPVPLGITTSIELANEVSRVQTANVIGILPGRDPKLASEYVVYSAHHDHLGIGEPNDAGDTIYNGARDNASGSAMTLAVGRAIAAHPEPPRRSIMLLFVGGEEQGLLGSEYYAAHPTVHPGKIAANINIDSANIWGRTRNISLIGLGKSSLDDVARSITERQGRTLEGDPFPDRGYYYRSDQFSFAQIGVPALYFHTGTDFVDRPEGWGEEQMNAYTNVNYHQPSDTLSDDWNFDGLIEDAQLGYWAGLTAANADEMPSWTPGDEFEAVRKAAINQVN